MGLPHRSASLLWGLPIDLHLCCYGAAPLIWGTVMGLPHRSASLLLWGCPTDMRHRYGSLLWGCPIDLRLCYGAAP